MSSYLTSASKKPGDYNLNDPDKLSPRSKFPRTHQNTSEDRIKYNSKASNNLDINSYNVYDYNTIGKNASHQKKNVDKNQLQKMLQFL